MRQLSLELIKEIYTEEDKPLSNSDLYDKVAEKMGINRELLNLTQEIGENKSKHSLLKRKIRWYQQTLKHANIIGKVNNTKGLWGLANLNKKGLHEASDLKMLAFSTNLGIAIWGKCSNVFSSIHEEIHLCITSPPYPLKVPKSYGNVIESEYVEFILRSLEPIVKNLIDGGSIVINISNDIFENKSPSRSLYIERLILSLHDELGLFLMDRIPWIDLSKPPTPTHWACVNPFQLCTGWEPIFWFTNNPLAIRSNNRNVLQPHTKNHLQLMFNGGEKRNKKYSDGAHIVKEKSFSNITSGKIPKNVIFRGHQCKDSNEYRRIAKQLNLSANPCMYPTSIPEFFINFLTKEGELVVDLFCGSNKTGLAAERNKRRWIACDIILEYLRIQCEQFKNFEGFKINPSIEICY